MQNLFYANTKTLYSTSKHKTKLTYALINHAPLLIFCEVLNDIWNGLLSITKLDSYYAVLHYITMLQYILVTTNFN